MTSRGTSTVRTKHQYWHKLMSHLETAILLSPSVQDLSMICTYLYQKLPFVNLLEIKTFWIFWTLTPLMNYNLRMSVNTLVRIQNSFKSKKIYDLLLSDKNNWNFNQQETSDFYENKFHTAIIFIFLHNFYLKK